MTFDPNKVGYFLDTPSTLCENIFGISSRNFSQSANYFFLVFPLSSTFLIEAVGGERVPVAPLGWYLQQLLREQPSCLKKIS